MSTGLDIATHTKGTAFVVRMAGALVGTDADTAAVGDALSEVSAPGTVIFDLGEVRLLAAAGVRALLAVVDSLQTRGIRCRIVVGSDSPIATVLAVAKLHPAVLVIDTVEEALEQRKPLTISAVANARTDIDMNVLEVEFASLTKAPLDATTPYAVLRQIVTATVAVVPGADMASVTLHDPADTSHTPTETDPIAGILDKVQYRTGSGRVSTRQVRMVPSTRSAMIWPMTFAGLNSSDQQPVSGSPRCSRPNFRSPTGRTHCVGR